MSSISFKTPPRKPGPDYVSWIVVHYPTKESAFMKCAEATEAMVKAFPELKRVRGYVRLRGVWDLQPHWWCLDPSGMPVDPTAHQWPEGVTEYESLPDDFVDPIGKCMICGAYCFEANGGTQNACCPEHEAELKREYNIKDTP